MKKLDFIHFFSIFTGLLALVVTAIPVFVTISETVQPVLFSCVGAAWTAFTATVQYWFGSSKGSKDKSSQIENMNKEVIT